MLTLYKSEVTGKTYDTVEELEKDELAVKEEEEKKEALKAQRKERADEVDAAFAKAREAQKEANELLAAFCRDYGAFHKTYHDVKELPSIFNFFPFL